MLRILRSFSLVLVGAAVLAPTAAHAATKSKPVFPTVSSISPRKLTIGQKLTVTGTHFRAGKAKSSVVFFHTGKPVVFVKAEIATTTKLIVTVPATVAGLLAQRNGASIATQLRLRVVGTKMGASWTKNSRSPIVSPTPAAKTLDPTSSDLAPAAVSPAALAGPTCQQQAAAAPGADRDADGVLNGIELSFQMDPCNADTDGDGMTDGYEYFSALDLNGALTPYPGTRPWPNPLDPSDGANDFDGDGLSEFQESALWKATHAAANWSMPYSDGTQNSGGSQPVVSSPLDLNHDGNLTDDERDEDGDGLSNQVEMNYRGTQSWWTEVITSEKPYGIRTFNDLDATNRDTDGDGVLDGADDQDNDGWSNYAEMELSRAEIGYRVQPYNPCLPDPHAAVCSRYTRIGMDSWPPFDGTQVPGDAIPFGSPSQDYLTWVGNGSHNPVGVTPGPWNLPGGWFRRASSHRAHRIAARRPGGQPLGRRPFSAQVRSKHLDGRTWRGPIRRSPNWPSGSARRR
jgi:hypothetical protein